MFANRMIVNNKNFTVIHSKIVEGMRSKPEPDADYETEYFKSAGRFYDQCTEEGLTSTCIDIVHWVTIQMKKSVLDPEEVGRIFEQSHIDA